MGCLSVSLIVLLFGVDPGGYKLSVADTLRESFIEDPSFLHHVAELYLWGTRVGQGASSYYSKDLFQKCVFFPNDLTNCVDVSWVLHKVGHFPVFWVVFDTLIKQIRGFLLPILEYVGVAFHFPLFVFGKQWENNLFLPEVRYRLVEIEWRPVLHHEVLPASTDEIRANVDRRCVHVLKVSHTGVMGIFVRNQVWESFRPNVVLGVPCVMLRYKSGVVFSLALWHLLSACHALSTHTLLL